MRQANSSRIAACVGTIFVWTHRLGRRVSVSTLFVHSTHKKRERVRNSCMFCELDILIWIPTYFPYFAHICALTPIYPVTVSFFFISCWRRSNWLDVSRPLPVSLLWFNVHCLIFSTGNAHRERMCFGLSNKRKKAQVTWLIHY